MPRPKKPGSSEPKTRSRHGCWPCKHRKIKCGEEKPSCQNCERNSVKCDYSIKLNWTARNKKGGATGGNMLGASSFGLVQLDSPTSSSTPMRSPVDVPQHSPVAINFNSANPSPTSFASPPGFQRHPSTSTEGKRSREPSNGSIFQPLEPVVNSRDPNPSPFQRLREHSEGSYPSPAESSTESPTGLHMPALRHLPTSNPDMRPPHSNLSPPSHIFGNTIEPSRESGYTEEQRPKKMKHHSSSDVSEIFSHTIYQSHNHSPAHGHVSPYRPSSLPHNSYGPPYSSPPRIRPTSTYSNAPDDLQRPFARLSSQSSIETRDDRRVSVASLLSNPAADERPFPGKLSIASTTSSDKHFYGVDRGLPDQDIPKNDDQNALSDTTPKLSSVAPVDTADSDAGMEDCHSTFGFALDATDNEEYGAYYSRPVPVRISCSLEPLPDELSQNPMNLLYFHHFLDHTARILVPHDCSENPFKNILPKMALQDPTLLHLLLSYSACHRSRLLGHMEPRTRISRWMNGVFFSLSAALNPGSTISDSNLAAAIMLASLEIIAPKSFEIEIPWQKHLNIARQMLVQRCQGRPVHRGDTVAYFLTRWFAYLDVLGSLAGRSNDQPLFHGNYWAVDSFDDETAGYQIDCLLGFTSRCVSILAKISELARQCDAERLLPDGSGRIRSDWTPSASTSSQAQTLKTQLEAARMHRYHGCPHRKTSIGDTRDSESYAIELVTTNDAFHWAGLIHLHRRVLGKQSSDPEVQMYVREIATALYKIRKGGPAESCLLFPMFTAGCEAKEQSQRDVIMERLKSVEGSGMFQVGQARQLMEKVWQTGRSWESFGGEFIG